MFPNDLTCLGKEILNSQNPEAIVQNSAIFFLKEIIFSALKD